jgi:ribose/xylose/arabinose/galactoside ABC-type transport system permease subunit
VTVTTRTEANTIVGAESRRTQIFVRFRNAGVLAILVLLVVGAAIATPDHNFIRGANLRTLLSLGSEFGIVVLGVGVLMIAGEFDLSIGSVLAFCSLIFTLLIAVPVNPFLAALVTLVCGSLIGTLNGLITVKAKVVSFIATLGTMLFWRGLTLMLSGGTMRSAVLEDHPFFVNLFTGRLGGIIPAQGIWFVFFALVLGLVLQKRRFGNWIYATGDNALAARAMAINTDWVKIVCFIIVASLVAFSAVIQTTRLAAFSSRVGTGWELRAVAAAVVGGTSLLGGRGSMLGIFLGALIIMVIENMVGLARLAYEWTYMALGLVTLGAVLLDLYVERRVQRATAA